MWCTFNNAVSLNFTLSAIWNNSADMRGLIAELNCKKTKMGTLFLGLVMIFWSDSWCSTSFFRVIFTPLSYILLLIPLLHLQIFNELPPFPHFLVVIWPQTASHLSSHKGVFYEQLNLFVPVHRQFEKHIWTHWDSGIVFHALEPSLRKASDVSNILKMHVRWSYERKSSLPHCVCPPQYLHKLISISVLSGSWEIAMNSQIMCHLLISASVSKSKK